MEKSVLKAIERFSLLENTKEVTVALSGGADSMSLLYAFFNLKERLGISLSAAHLNHMIRGEEALRDEEFVKKQCKSLKVPLFCERIDVVPYSDDIPSYIINALAPAEILAIDINDEEKIATVVVPDESLSVAIGAGGQNVRLAAILTGWKIDIKTETQIKEKVVE